MVLPLVLRRVSVPAIRRGVKLALLAALLGGTVPAPARAGRQAPAPAPAYLCPMHPDVVSRTPGTCPRCGMQLATGNPFDAREYVVESEARPAAPPAGVPFRLRLTVREPWTRLAADRP